MDISTKTLQEL